MIACRSSRSPCRGFTILETMISILIVSGMMIAAVGTVEATHRVRRIAHDRPRADLLAHDLMAEILLTPSYEEPFGVVDFGPEGAEAASGRAAFDDIDDYHGWSSTPPRARDGSILADLAGWTRSAVVTFAAPSDLAADAGSDNGIKVVTVTISRAGEELATLTSLRTESWEILPQ